MKKLALLTTVLIGSSSALTAGELENLRSANAEQKRQISTLEKEIDNLYSLLDREIRTNGGKSHRSNKSALTSNSNYTVVAGDSLSKIARKHNTSLANLLKANKINSSTILRIGQKLKVPSTAKTISTASSVSSIKSVKQAPKQTAKQEKIPRVNIVNLASHTVASGDTFYGIARKHKVSVNDLKLANPKLKPSALRIGQKIQIPGGKAIASKPVTISADTKKVSKVASTNKKSKSSKVASTRRTTSSTMITAPFVKQNITPVNNTPTRKPVTISAPSVPAPEVLKSIYLDKPIKFSDLAKKYKTSVEALNELNDWSYSGNIILARGSEIYLPN